MSITVCRSPARLPEDCFLVRCAVSGGTLEEFLGKALEAAHGILCVRIAPVYMDFTLPCFSGAGALLTEEEAARLAQGKTRRFSQALCTDYFCYLAGETLHTVLADTPETLRKKLRMAEAAGVPYALAETEAVYRLLTGR